jgi:hypothetical protein
MVRCGEGDAVGTTDQQGTLTNEESLRSMGATHPMAARGLVLNALSHLNWL